MKTFLVLLVGALLIWIAYGYFSSRVKEPKFRVLQKHNGYVIREYSPYIEARVELVGDYRVAQTSGFRVLAGYIFGGNTTKQSIVMTAPVIEQKSESIAMTAPVLEQVSDRGMRIISFVMPEEYTLETLPIPDDKRIEIKEVKSHKSAVLCYSGYNDAEMVAQMKEKLLAYLERDGATVIGEPRGARYNPPWTPPFLTRNEILVDVK